MDETLEEKVRRLEEKVAAYEKRLNNWWRDKEIAVSSALEAQSKWNMMAREKDERTIERLRAENARLKQQQQQQPQQQKG